MVRVCCEVETAECLDPDYLVLIDESRVGQKLLSVNTVGHRFGLHLGGFDCSVLPALGTGDVTALGILGGSMNT